MPRYIVFLAPVTKSWDVLYHSHRISSISVIQSNWQGLCPRHFAEQQLRILSLETVVTRSRLTLLRNPFAFGGGGSTPLSLLMLAYSLLSSKTCVVQPLLFS